MLTLIRCAVLAIFLYGLGYVASYMLDKMYTVEVSVTTGHVVRVSDHKGREVNLTLEDLKKKGLLYETISVK